MKEDLAHALRAWADVSTEAATQEEAEDAFREALEIYIGLEDPMEQSITEAKLALHLERSGDETGRPMLEGAVERARLGDEEGIGRRGGLQELGLLLFDAGKLDEAETIHPARTWRSTADSASNAVCPITSSIWATFSSRGGSSPRVRSLRRSPRDPTNAWRESALGRTFESCGTDPFRA